VNRRLAIAIALLSLTITGATCEFRAASNTPIRGDTPEEGEKSRTDTGLLVNVSSGRSRTLTTASIDGSETVEAALITSVLSLTPVEPIAVDEPSLVRDPVVAERVPEPVVLEIAVVPMNDPETRPMASAVPEPAAAVLFAAGSLVLLRRFRPASERRR